MRTFIVVLLIALAAACAAEEKDGFEDWFGMVEAQGGTVWNIETGEWEPFLSAPLGGWKAVRLVIGGEFDAEDMAQGPIAAHLALTYNLGTLKEWGLDMPLAQYLGLNIGPSWRYEIASKESSVSFMATIVDVSFGEGNVEKQKKRKAVPEEAEDESWSSIKAMYR